MSVHQTNEIGYVQIDKIKPIIDAKKSTFLSGKTLPAEYRRLQLEKLYAMLNDNENEWVSAIQSDIQNRPKNEIVLTELSTTKSEIAHLLNNLEKYMAPKKVTSSAAFLTDSGYFHYNPLGNVLLIAPWNFPLHLTISPLAGIIAAGCTAIIKPSEVSANTSQLMAKLIPRYLDPESYQVVLGGVTETTEILKYKFDLIFYTGSSHVGKIIAQAAAKHLTPMVLELGGKNPVVVDDTSDLTMVAKRVAWGRWCLNCGQICLGPEYIIINKSLQEKLVQEFKKQLLVLFGDNPQLSPFYARIINAHHFRRVKKMLDENKQNVVIGGQFDERDNFIAPTVLANVDDQSPVMKEEVFGPILSIFPVDDVRTDAIPLLQSKEKPLAMYIFTQDQSFADKVIERTDAGGVCVNDVVIQCTFPGLSFGGVGNSGQGSYHGWHSFAACSHEKPVLKKYAGGEAVNNIRNPPFTDAKATIFKAIAEEKPSKWSKYFKISPVTALALAGGAYYMKSKL